MSEIPSILVTDGWETDQNDALEEIVIPSTVETLNVPTKVTFMGDTLNWLPSTVAALNELTLGATTISSPNFTNYTNLVTLNLPNATVFTNSNSGSFLGCTALKFINAPNLELLTCDSPNTSNGIFRGCTGLVSVTFPKLKIINNNNRYFLGGTFYNCINLTTFEAPELTTINCKDCNNNQGGVFTGCLSLSVVSLPKLEIVDNSGGSYSTNAVFYGCTALQTISLPKIKKLITGNSGVFSNCTGLTDVTLGSAGNPVTSIGSVAFGGCTQSNLTITVYTEGGASLSGEKWGATNATIIYKEA